MARQPVSYGESHTWASRRLDLVQRREKFAGRGQIPPLYGCPIEQKSGGIGSSPLTLPKSARLLLAGDWLASNALAASAQPAHFTSTGGI